MAAYVTIPHEKPEKKVRSKTDVPTLQDIIEPYDSKQPTQYDSSHQQHVNSY